VLVSNEFDVLKVGDIFLLEADFFDGFELLSSFPLFVEEVCVFIPRFKPQTSCFLPPIFLLLAACSMEVSMELLFFLQGDGVNRMILCLELVLL